MGNRIKQIRKALGITQQEMSSRLGISRNNIATYETGKSKPGDSVISLICHIFNVNETWLRTGDGEMFISQTRSEDIKAFFEDAIKSEGSFKQRLVAALSRLDENDWELIEGVLDKLMAREENYDTLVEEVTDVINGGSDEIEEAK